MRYFYCPGLRCNAVLVKNDPHFSQSGAAGGFRSRLRFARWNYELDGDAAEPGAGGVLAGNIKQNASQREHNAACVCEIWCLRCQKIGVLTGIFLLHRSLVEEFRKTLCSLWQGSQTAFSPDSLFYTIWKIMPSFRLESSDAAAVFL